MIIPGNPSASRKYTVIVYTGDVDAAGTNANVKITLFGDSATCGPQIIDDSKDNFERNAYVSQYDIEYKAKKSKKKTIMRASIIYTLRVYY